MKMDTSSRLRTASWVSMLALLFVILAATTTSTCEASPVTSPAEAAPAAAAPSTSVEKPVSEVAVEVEMDDDSDDDEATDSPAAREKEEDVTVSEELTQGAIIVGNMDASLDSESVEASYFVNSFVDPRLLRLVEGATDEESEEEVENVGQARVGEIGTIISVIKIATELGEAVLPVVIREVESSPIGNLVIGVIGGFNDGASGASADGMSAAFPIPIKLVRRAARSFLMAHQRRH